MDMTEQVSTETKEETLNDLNVFEDYAKTGRTLNNIKKTLSFGLKSELPEDNDKALAKKTNALLSIHGLHQDQFDFIGTAENLINARILNDQSIDANANKSEKTIESLMQETMAPMKKAIGYDELYRQMKKDWGKEEAKRLSGEMYSYALALADSTAILKCYCFSIDARRLVLEGRSFGQLYSKPAKRLVSYISALSETVHQLSNHLAGAVAIGTFFFDCAHVLMYTDNTFYNPKSSKKGYSLFKIRHDAKVRKYIENEYQQFIHSVNHLSRNASESPFTNISVFDKPKIKTLLEGEKLMSYYPGKKEEEVIEYIMEIQKLFINFFDKGDPTSGGMPIRFPVITVNFSKDENGKLLDEDFVSYMCNKDIYRYNIFASKGTKLASCCFRENVKVDTYNKDTKKISSMNFKDFYNSKENLSLIGPDNKPKENFEKLCIDYDDNWIEVVTEECSTIYYTKDHIVPTEDGDIKASELKVGSMIKYNNEESRPNKKFAKVVYIDNKFENKEKKAYCVKFSEKEDPYFKLTGGIITHNCRLINDVDTMKEYAAQSNSFGGVGISLGSHRVITINFNRLTLESKTKEDYFKLLDQRIEDSAKILRSHKNLLKMLADKGMQLFIQNGWIPMDKLFSTFGILGLVEANEYARANYSEYKEDGTDFIKDSLVYLNEKMIEQSRKYNIIGNIEQIPAESMAVRLAKADKLLFGEDKVPFKLYANQFIPLWKEATIWDKMMTDGYYNQLITGGGIVHAQIGERVTPKQAKKIIEFSVKSGCEHFALNAVYSVCSKGHTTFGKQKTCPVCGDQNMEHFTRVVGFFTKVENWNTVRRDWEFDKRTFVTLPDENEEPPEIDTTKIAKHINLKD